ncbi:hypothetical protein SAMN04488564_1314 [Lentzea waywayandensis]|uniref:Terpene synthase n=1 Tax=Lentzea waywayandensis TaxID=84724 RepID=A0A1I6FJS3_9PSEU|nr:hypothetical protein [Lentzea waywayandensis]SFR30175.1 hypothetical protein SAMN04488564_1314 [Lentzea waywayandensis]
MDITQVVSLWCPIASAIHPNWQVWERNTMQWINEFHLESEQQDSGRLPSIAAGELAARTALNPADECGGQLSADSLMWLFAFDDAYCDEGRYSHSPAAMAMLVAEMVRVAETGHTSSRSPLARALVDLRHRLDRLATPEQAARWTHAMRGYLTYQVWEAAYRSGSSMPTLDEYAVARIRNGSMEVCAMVLDIAEGYVVPGDELERADVRALTEMACSIVGWDNDIASYYKEHERSGDKLNLVDVMANELGVTPDESLPDVVAFRDATLDLFLRLQRQVAPEVSAETRRYVNGLASWIRGNLDWSLNTARYRRPDRASITVTEVREREMLPIGPPSGVAWWWHQLAPAPMNA